MRVAPGLILGLAALAACGGPDATGPSAAPPYLAIVAKREGAAVPLPGGALRYRVVELSGTLHVDTTIVAQPSDTIVLSVKPASYNVELSGLPAQCRSRYGDTATVVIPEKTNTAVARYFIRCDASLTVTLATDGSDTDSAYVLETNGPSGQRLDVLRGLDTLVMPQLAAGDYTLQLRHVGENCVVTSQGGGLRTVHVPDAGGAAVDFQIRCADPSFRPSIRRFHSSYHDGAGVFIAELTMPDHNPGAYYWDLTDCNGRSLLPFGEMRRDQLNNGRTRNADTLTVIGAFEIGLPDASAAGRCAALRVEDTFGNTSARLEQPLEDPAVGRPSADSFNAILNGPDVLLTRLAASDPESDLVGAFVAARLRDGTLQPRDGADDIGIYSPQGYLGTTVPDLPLTGRVLYTDVYGIIVYLVDARGHFTRVEDDDTFH